MVNRSDKSNSFSVQKSPSVEWLVAIGESEGTGAIHISSIISPVCTCSAKRSRAKRKRSIGNVVILPVIVPFVGNPPHKALPILVIRPGAKSCRPVAYRRVERNCRREIFIPVIPVLRVYTVLKVGRAVHIHFLTGRQSRYNNVNIYKL